MSGVALPVLVLEMQLTTVLTCVALAIAVPIIQSSLGQRSGSLPEPGALEAQQNEAVSEEPERLVNRKVSFSWFIPSLNKRVPFIG